MNLILYHLPNSRSQRLVWLFEELSLEYQLDIHHQHTLATSEIPLKFPTLSIQISNQTQIWTETSAIAEYFCQLKQKLILNPQQPQYWDFCHYKQFADASFMPNLALKQVFQHIKLNTPWLARWLSMAYQSAFNRAYLNPQLNVQLRTLNQHLSKNTWLVGETFSYADILLWFPLHAAQYASPKFSEFKHLTAYLDQIAQRPAFIESLKRGEWSSSAFQCYWSVTK